MRLNELSMGYKLRKREYVYAQGVLKKLAIDIEEAAGLNFLQISDLIAKKYRRLALRFHPDKPGGSDKEIKSINDSKQKLLKYIEPLRNGGRLISNAETELLKQQSKIDFNDRRTKYAVIFILVDLLLMISLCISYIYLGIRLFKAANFATTPGILFSASLITAISTFLLTLYFFFSVAKKASGLLQVQGGTLDQEELKEALQKEIAENRKYISQYASYFSLALLITGLALQYQSNYVDTTVLIGLVAVLGCTLLRYLVVEVYERKVVELIKIEEKESEQKEKNRGEGELSTSVDPKSSLNVGLTINFQRALTDGGINFE